MRSIACSPGIRISQTTRSFVKTWIGGSDDVESQRLELSTLVSYRGGLPGAAVRQTEIRVGIIAPTSP